MADTSSTKSGGAVVLLALLAVIWGSSFILMKRGLLLYSPLQIGCLRMFTASLVMIPFAVRSFKSILPGQWKYLLATGLLGNALPSILFPLAETGISSALAGMINTLTPIFTLLVGFLFFGITHARKNLLGLLIGLAGALLLILGGGSGIQAASALTPLYVVAATVCYAFSVNILRNKLNGLHPLAITSFALLFVGLPMGGVLFTTDFISRSVSSPQLAISSGSILLLGVFGTAVSTVLFNRLIQVSGALVASSVTYLIPLVAAVWGLLDGERIGLHHIAGLVLILSGVYLINRKR